MIYFVFETQVTKDKKTGKETSAVNVFSFDNKKDAESKYHEILMYGAKSDIYKHGAILFTEDMFIIKSEVYTHND
ncbi:MAG: hypothetical protein J6R06_08315 [Bacteroidales bacterium]|nr:hypothetical protein [Bacteroidales bacterium]